MALIEISNLTFCHEGGIQALFEQVSLQLDSRWKLGLIGRNGRGKTTFLRLLMGEYPYQGRIDTSVTFDYFPFSLADPSMLTLALLQSMDAELQQWELQRELSLLGVEEEVLDRPFSSLSGGERTKVLIAALFVRKNRFLLLDEPTNHLDAQGKQLMGDYLSKKSGFILVSHDRVFLDQVVDHVLSINRTDITLQKGNFSSWQHNRQLQQIHEQGENDRLQKEIKQLRSAARRTAQWSDRVEASKIGEHAPDRGYIGHKAAKMMKRSKNLQARQQQAIQEKSHLLREVDAHQPLTLLSKAHHRDRLVEAQALSLCYGGKQVLRNISFTLMQGERVAVTGGNGAGKTSLIRLLLGQTPHFSGQLRLASGLHISYIPQDISFLRGRLRDFIAESNLEPSLFQSVLRKLDFDRDQFDRPLEQYSDGQKKKVLISRSLCQEAHLYIWDEPLNYIDVLSRIQLEEMILRCQPTMLFVEHDRMFCEKVATRELLLQA